VCVNMYVFAEWHSVCTRCAALCLKRMSAKTLPSACDMVESSLENNVQGMSSMCTSSETGDFLTKIATEVVHTQAQA